MPWVEALGAAIRELDNVSPGMVTPVTVLHFLSDIACHAAGGKRASITFSRRSRHDMTDWWQVACRITSQDLCQTGERLSVQEKVAVIV